MRNSVVKQAPEIQLLGFSLSYLDAKLKSEKRIISGLNQVFAAAKFHIILGKSGCGKSSLLNAISGLLPQNAQINGEIRISGEYKSNFIMQENNLLPWLDAKRNITLGSNLRGKKVDENNLLAVAKLCSIDEFLTAKPQNLSGGQKQRVALARCLYEDDNLILLDEPFSALDAITRYQLQNLIVELFADKTVLMITHDPQEALRIADKLYVLQNNQLKECPLPNSKTPRDFTADGFAELCSQLLQELGR